jgi:transposase
MKPTALALGITSSSLDARIKRDGVQALVKSLRPRKPSPTEERALVQDALQRHQGQMHKVHEELGISKGTLLDRVRKYKLHAEADALRLEANLIGPRTRLPKSYDLKRRRAKLSGLLESSNWRVSKVAVKLGVSVGTVYNMMKQLGIEPRAQKTQQRMHRLIRCASFEQRRHSSDGTRARRSTKDGEPVVQGIWCVTTAATGGRNEFLRQLCCKRDEGRPLGIGLQDQVPNHRKLLGSNGLGGERLRKRRANPVRYEPGRRT